MYLHHLRNSILASNGSVYKIASYIHYIECISNNHNLEHNNFCQLQKLSKLVFDFLGLAISTSLPISSTICDSRHITSEMEISLEGFWPSVSMLETDVVGIYVILFLLHTFNSFLDKSFLNFFVVLFFLLATCLFSISY